MFLRVVVLLQRLVSGGGGVAAPPEVVLMLFGPRFSFHACSVSRFGCSVL
jgi:hypothetical protein